MKRLILGVIILFSLNSYAQEVLTLPEGEVAFGSNDSKRSGIIKQGRDTTPCAFMIIDTTGQYKNGSKTYYITGYKVNIRKGELIYWADHSCPENRAGCAVYHTTWREVPLPIIETYYLNDKKIRYKNKNYIINEVK